MRQAIIGAAILSLAFGGGMSSPAFAQKIVNPPSIDASNPLRQKAESIARLVFEGKLTEAATLLKDNAVPGSPAATDADAQVASLKDTFGEGGFRIARVAKGAEDLVMVLGIKPGVGRAAVAVQLETAAPYRFKELTQPEVHGGGNR